jgi:hypothetical protein
MAHISQHPFLHSCTRPSPRTRKPPYRTRPQAEKPKGTHRPRILRYNTSFLLSLTLSSSSSFPVNDRDKVIPLKHLQVTAIQKKVQLLLDSSGAKILPLKRRSVESTTESPRGIWSGLHADRPAL